VAFPNVSAKWKVRMNKNPEDATLAPSTTLPGRTWGDVVLGELPDSLSELRAGGVAGLSSDRCARVLVLAGQARQFGATDPTLDALADDAERFAAALIARTPLDEPQVLFDETDAALTQEPPQTTDPLDALLRCDDWFTAFGFCNLAGVALDGEPEELGSTLAALVAAVPEVVADLGHFAAARTAGLAARANETPAWRALAELWRAVAEAPVLEGLTRTQGAHVPDAIINERLRQIAPNTSMRLAFPTNDIAPFFEHRSAAHGNRLARTPEPLVLGYIGTTRVAVVYGGPRRTGPIVELTGLPQSTHPTIRREGTELFVEVDEFGAHVFDARPGHYSIQFGDRTCEFILTRSNDK
jgi:hypothetical protein